MCIVLIISLYSIPQITLKKLYISNTRYQSHSADFKTLISATVSLRDPINNGPQISV